MVYANNLLAGLLFGIGFVLAVAFCRVALKLTLLN